MTIYNHPSDKNLTSPYPFDRELALKLRKKFYDAGEKCPKCDHCRLRYVKTGICKICAEVDAHNGHLQALDENVATTPEEAIRLGEDAIYYPPHPCPNGHTDGFNVPRTCVVCERTLKNPRAEARKAGETYYTPEKPCPKGHMAKRTVANDACTECRGTSHSAARTAARRGGETYYTPEKPCPKGHTGLRTVAHDVCLECKALKKAGKLNSPRVAARRAGLYWYTPETPCPNGHLAVRSVNSDICYECREISKAQHRSSIASESVNLMRDNPDLIMDKHLARMLGYKVYRTGLPCSRGHVAWRYTANGGCLECKKR